MLKWNKNKGEIKMKMKIINELVIVDKNQAIENIIKNLKYVNNHIYCFVCDYYFVDVDQLNKLDKQIDNITKENFDEDFEAVCLKFKSNIENVDCVNVDWIDNLQIRTFSIVKVYI